MSNSNYESPEVSKIQEELSPVVVSGNWFYMDSVAVGEVYVAAIIAGVFFQVAFQIDTTYPV